MKINLPADFKEFSLSSFAPDVVERYLAAMEEGSQTVSIRVNRAKIGEYGPKEWLEKFTNFSYGGEVKWASDGLYLLERPSFSLDPLFHAGLYYVQDASSMFMQMAFEAIENEAFDGSIKDKSLKVLDLCASPGGKSTHILSLISRSSLLVSNEAIAGRTAALAENIARWGADNVVVSNNDASDFRRLDSFFDIILVDAPCSGEGMFRKSPEAVSNWSRDNVNLSARRQRRILSDIWPALAPGGFLIYSTCTYNNLENDSNLLFLLSLGATIVKVAEPSRLSSLGVIATQAGGYQFIPGSVNGEGQYFAVVRKDGSSSFHGVPLRPNSKRPANANSSQKADLKEFRALFPNYEFALYSSYLKGYRKELYPLFLTLSTHLRIVSSALLFGQIKGADFIPHADLALSFLLTESLRNNNLHPFSTYFKSYNLNPDSVFKFLSKQLACLPPDAPLGYLLILYEGWPLGFVKNLGTRINYPRGGVK